MHFMLETIIAAHLLGVDPFDQPAVEEGKVLAKQPLPSGVSPFVSIELSPLRLAPPAVTSLALLGGVPADLPWTSYMIGQTVIGPVPAG